MFSGGKDSLGRCDASHAEVVPGPPRAGIIH